jgi:hypothetical protein
MSNSINEQNDFGERLLQCIHSYNLNEDEKKWITEFIQVSPECFSDLDDDIKTIILDGIIDLHDIPFLIKLFAVTYNSEMVKQDIVNSKYMITFIKFSLNVLLEPQFLILSKIEIDIVEKVINTSLSLLTMNLENIGEVEKKIFKNTCCFY